MNIKKETKKVTLYAQTVRQLANDYDEGVMYDRQRNMAVVSCVLCVCLLVSLFFGVCVCVECYGPCFAVTHSIAQFVCRIVFVNRCVGLLVMAG